MVTEDVPVTPVARAAASIFTFVLISGILSFVFVIVVARTAGPAVRGALAFVVTVSTLLAFASTLGLDTANLYFAGKDRSAGRSLAFVSLLAGSVAAGVLGLVAWGVFLWKPHWVPRNVTHGLLTVGLAASLLMACQLLMISILIGTDHLRAANAIRLLPPSASLVVFIVAVSASHADAKVAVFSWVVGQVAGFVLAIVLVARLVGVARPAKAAGWSRTLLRYGLAAHVGGLAEPPIRRFDAIVLGATRSATELGLYSAAVNVAEALMYIPASVSLALLPAGASRSERESMSLTRRVLIVVLFVSSAIGALGIIGAPHIVLLVFGRDFAGAATPLRFLMIAAVGWGASRGLATSLAARGRQGFASLISLGTLAVIISADLVLIPRHGASGAAWASAGTYWFGAAMMYGAFRRAYKATGPGRGSFPAETRAAIDAVITAFRGSRGVPPIT